MRHLRIAAEACLFLPGGRVTDDTSVLTLKTLVFEPLLRWTEGGRAAPALLARWEVGDGGRRWLFHLRDGAVFHDGVACTSRHVLDTIEAVLGSVDMFGMKWSYSRYLARARLSTPTPSTLLVENPEPFADILDILSEFFVAREDAAGAPVLGTGPYRVTGFAEGVAELARVGDAPGPERISFRAIPHAEDRMAALHSGEADVAMQLERMQAGPRFEDRFAWGRQVSTLSVMHYLNCAEGAFAHPAARLAINLAVDRQMILDTLFQGLGVLSSTVVSPLHMGAGAAGLEPLPHDPDRAKRLFEAAQVGGPLRLRTPTHMPEKALAVTQAVADALGRLGIGTRIEIQRDRPEYAREVGRKAIGDVAIFDSSPHSTFRVLDDKISSASRAVWWQGYHDEEAQRLIAAASRAVEDEAREAAYGAVLRRLHANPPWLYLFHPVGVFAARPGAGRFVLEGTGILRVEG
ncbi:ABC transporter substrate-binding protein [Falsiroseomonas oryzae]|uniref:ABC transporter substrate-binding protein n=1 Tax=Falsiroseomonas oryzae TaxID=2766473 RepID=UPI0022EA91D1|nr:ABC transporter substrate-binding protein [Roseomonas sp. MO-31]